MISISTYHDLILAFSQLLKSLPNPLKKACRSKFQWLILDQAAMVLTL